MARVQMPLFLFGLFFAHVQSSLFGWLLPNAKPFEYLVGAGIVATDDYLYVDGGVVYTPVKHGSVPIYYNHTLRISLREHWNNRTVKPDRISRPGAVVMYHTLFYDSQNSEVYAFGGYLLKNNAPSPMSTLKSPEDTNAHWTISGSQPPHNILGHSGGLSANSPQVFYNLGGGFVKDYQNLLQYQGLLEFDKATRVWTNASSKGFHDGYGSLGSGTYLADYGSEGVLVFLGGITGHRQPSNYSKQSVENHLLEDMSRIYIYDIANKEFLLQTATSASGALPVGRSSPCMVSVQDSDSGNYDLFLFGGEGALPISNDDERRDLESVWVLSLPSFQWTRIDSSAGGQTRAGQSCSVIGARQMVIVGGEVEYSKSSYVADNWTDGLGLFDMGALQWSDGYDPNAPAYTRQKLLVDNARKQPYPTHWNSQAVKNIFNATQNSSSGTDIGAIAGGVIGGVAGLVLIATAIWFFWWRRKRNDAAAPSLEPPKKLANDDFSGSYGRQEKPELHAESRYFELPTSQSMGAELLGSERGAWELPGSGPKQMAELP